MSTDYLAGHYCLFFCDDSDGSASVCMGRIQGLVGEQSLLVQWVDPETGDHTPIHRLLGVSHWDSLLIYKNYEEALDEFLKATDSDGEYDEFA